MYHYYSYKPKSKIRPVEYNSCDNPYKYSEAGWRFKKEFEHFKKKYAEYYIEQLSDGTYVKHRNQG